MLWIAFYFLCCSGEYTAASADSRPFQYCDTQFWLGPRQLALDSAPEAQLLSASCSALTFTNQKNCVPGEVVALGVSGASTACGTRAIGRRIAYLRAHNAPGDTPLCAFMQHGAWHVVSEAMVTQLLRQAAAIVGPSVGFLPKEVSARSLRASGAMAMMCGGIDSTTTHLRGRWRSDTMLRYLTVQAAPLVADAASRMLRGGDYRLVPGQDVPDIEDAIADADGSDVGAPPAAAAAPVDSIPDDAMATVAAAAAAIAAANPPAPAA